MVVDGYISISRREGLTSPVDDKGKVTGPGDYKEVVVIRVVDADHHFMFDVEMELADYARASTSYVAPCKVIREEDRP